MGLFSHILQGTPALEPELAQVGTLSLKAFGVGALEEEDDDIYALDTLSKYDTVLKDEEPGDGLYGWTAPKQYKSQQGNSDNETERQ